MAEDIAIGSQRWIDLLLTVGQVVDVPNIPAGTSLHRADCFVADLRRFFYETGGVPEWPEHWGSKPRNAIDNDDAPPLASSEMTR